MSVADYRNYLGIDVELDASRQRTRACYTITPDTHDDQTVATLTGLFDDILD